MARKNGSNNDRARRMVAQEAARIIVNQGIRDYRVAKIKAAERLGMSTRGSLPGNVEIEAAVSEHLSLFTGESHADLLKALRLVALSVMEKLGSFTPRLVGPVLAGTADDNAAVNLHVFSDNAESIAWRLADLGIPYRTFERRLKAERDRAESFAGFGFVEDGIPVEVTVFPVDGIRQAPISPIDGRPMKRADEKAVRQLVS